MDKVIVIAGPTASGKSALAVEVAKRFNGEIISADSMQVYRQMDIGTAKIMPSEMEGIRHHLIDIIPYDHPWNVKFFQSACRGAIADIVSRGKVPVVCGGTGLYLKAALYDYEFEEEAENPVLQKELEDKSNDELIELLKEKDPKSLEKIHPNNRKRLLRAAFMACSGQIKSAREEQQRHEPLYDIYWVGLQDERAKEMARIDARVEKMFAGGLKEEVEKLFAKEESWEFTSFQGIGYKEFKDWFLGQKDLKQIQSDIALHTRQYAKRQMTWFRHQMPVKWYPREDHERILNDLENWLKGITS